MLLLPPRKKKQNQLKHLLYKKFNAKRASNCALQEQVASLSVQIASKVIEKELKEEDQVKLIRDYIKEVGEAR